MADDRLDQDLSYRYEERPKHAPVDHPAFQPTETWVNYWDYHPIMHGGRFLRYEADEWDIIEVTPPSAWTEPEHILTPHYVQPSDVWEDPSDPWTDFTDDMKSILRSLGDEHHLPAAAPFLERIDYYVADMVHYHRGGRGETFAAFPEGADEDAYDPDIYWNKVGEYGVDPADMADRLPAEETPSWLESEGDE